MKRLFSIFFLLVFLFNVGGYYFVFVGLRHSANKALTIKLNNDHYTEEETFLFKMPLTLAYQINQTDFERVEGAFEHNGEFYKLVKQKLANDTLYVVCIRDHKEKQLVSAMADFAKISNDVPSSRNDGLSLLSKLSKDYESHSIIEIITHSGWYLSTFYAHFTSSLPDREIPVQSPPPEIPS